MEYPEHLAMLRPPGGGGGDGVSRCKRDALQADKVLLLKVHRAILADKLINLIGVHLIRAHRFSVVTGQIIVVTPVSSSSGLLTSSTGLAEDVCPLDVGELTTFGLTDTIVAEIRTLERVAVRAADALVAVAIEAKVATD